MKSSVVYVKTSITFERDGKKSRGLHTSLMCIFTRDRGAVQQRLGQILIFTSKLPLCLPHSTCRPLAFPPYSALCQWWTHLVSTTTVPPSGENGYCGFKHTLGKIPNLSISPSFPHSSPPSILSAVFLSWRKQGRDDGSVEKSRTAKHDE